MLHPGKFLLIKRRGHWHCCEDSGTKISSLSEQCLEEFTDTRRPGILP